MIGCLVLLTLLVGGEPLAAQDPDSLRQEALQMKATSDSLYSVWDVLWKRSDSLRIESMLVRIQSSLLKRKSSTLLKKADEVEEKARLMIAAMEKEQKRLETERRQQDSMESLSPSLTDSEYDSSDTIESVGNGETSEPDIVELPESISPPARTVGDIVEDSEIVELLRLQEVHKRKAEQVRSLKVRRGQTISDSATALVMTVEPDTGVASYYGKKFHGRKTSSGAVFNMNDRTCAHRWLPYGTRLLVTNLSNGKQVVVTVNDRGPFKHGRLMDLSRKAAEDIGMIRSGTATVAIEVVEDD